MGRLCYRGERILTIKTQDNIFDLTQFILTKKMDQALTWLEIWLAGEDEIKLIAVMLVHSDLLGWKFLAESGQTESQLQVVWEPPDANHQIKFALRSQ